MTAQELKRVDKMTLQLQGSCIQRWEVIEYIKKKKKKKREKWRCLSTLKGFLLGDQKENCTFRKPVHIYLSYLHRLGSKSHKILLWFSNKRVEPAVRLYLHGGNAKTMSKERGALSYT